MIRATFYIFEVPELYFVKAIYMLCVYHSGELINPCFALKLAYRLTICRG